MRLIVMCNDTYSNRKNRIGTTKNKMNGMSQCANSIRENPTKIGMSIHAIQQVIGEIYGKWNLWFFYYCVVYGMDEIFQKRTFSIGHR